MAEYLPPTEDVAIFDTLNFNDGDAPLTYNKAVKYFLRYPRAQGTETLQTTNVNGLLTASAGIDTYLVDSLIPQSILEIAPTQTTGVLNIGTGSRSGTGSGGTINIGTGSSTSGSIINIGTGARDLSGTINIGTSSSFASQVSIGGGTGSVFLQGSTSVICGQSTTGTTTLQGVTTNITGGTGGVSLQSGNTSAVSICTASGRTGTLSIQNGATGANGINFGSNTSTIDMRGTVNLNSTTTSNNVYINSGNNNGATYINNGATNNGYVYIGNGGGNNNIRIGSANASINVNGNYNTEGGYTVNQTSTGFACNFNTASANAVGGSANFLTGSSNAGVVNMSTGSSNTGNVNILTGASNSGDIYISTGATASGDVFIGNSANTLGTTYLSSKNIEIGTNGVPSTVISLSAPLRPNYASTDANTAFMVGFQTATATSTTVPTGTINNIAQTGPNLDNGVWLIEAQFGVTWTGTPADSLIVYSVSATPSTNDPNRIHTMLMNKNLISSSYNGRISTVVRLTGTGNNIYLVAQVNGTTPNSSSSSIRWTRIA